MNHCKSLKLKINMDENVANFCSGILADSQRRDSVGAFKPKHFGYINCIFEDAYDYIFSIWLFHKYKEVSQFIRKLHVCDKYVIQSQDIITCESLFQEATREYPNNVDLNIWESADSKEMFYDEPFLIKAYTVVTIQIDKNNRKKFYLKSSASGKTMSLVVGSYTKSVATCHIWGKRAISIVILNPM